MKEKETRLLSKKLEMEANRGRTFEKPDEPIATITTKQEQDNAGT